MHLKCCVYNVMVPGIVPLRVAWLKTSLGATSYRKQYQGAVFLAVHGCSLSAVVIRQACISKPGAGLKSYPALVKAYAPTPICQCPTSEHSNLRAHHSLPDFNLHSHSHLICRIRAGACSSSLLCSRSSCAACTGNDRLGSSFGGCGDSRGCVPRQARP